MFGLGQPKGRTILARLEDAERALADVAKMQVELAEAYRSRGNVDAELRSQIGVVAHDVNKLVEIVGEPPAQVEETAESPFAGDNTAETEPAE